MAIVKLDAAGVYGACAAAGYALLAAPARREFDTAMQQYFEQFRREDGGVHWPRQALLIRGRRPVPRAGGAGEIFI